MIESPAEDERVKLSEALVEQMGIQKATEFVTLLERGQGDSVKDIAGYWGDASIDDIQNRIKEWKSKLP